MREIITTYSGLYIARNTFGYAAYQTVEDLAKNNPVTRYHPNVTKVMGELDRVLDPKLWEGGE